MRVCPKHSQRHVKLITRPVNATCKMVARMWIQRICEFMLAYIGVNIRAFGRAEQIEAYDVAGCGVPVLAVVEQARAEAQDCDLIVFPELQLIGYPPEDLVLKPALIERAAAELDRLAAQTGDGGPAMLVGSVFQREGALCMRRTCPSQVSASPAPAAWVPPF